MNRDYVVYPSMISSQSGIFWSYDNVTVVSPFDNTHPINVSTTKCDELSICVWYISPLWQFNDPIRTNYALLGELNKWTPISRQRFLSITTNTEKTQTTVIIQGVSKEIIQLGVYLEYFGSMIVNCSITNENGQVNLIITPTNAVCS